MTVVTRNAEARHHFRRLGLHRTACGAGARQARLSHPRGHAPARPRRPSAAARQCRPDPAGPGQCPRALVGRSRRRGRRPCHQPGRRSCTSPAARSSTPCRSSAPAPSRRPRAPPRQGSPTARRSAPTSKSWSAYARTKARGEKAVLETLKDAVIFRPSDRVRPGGPLLQPLRRDGAPFAGAAADRRRPHAIPAGVRRRRRRGDRPLRRRQPSRAAGSTSSAGPRC